MSDLVSCPTCKQDVALTGFGRCVICGDVLSDAPLKYRRVIFGFSNIYAAIGMFVGVFATAVCVVTFSIFGLWFTVPLIGASLRFRHSSL